MKTFSVEGTSATSMEEAMANAMANAAAAAGGSKHMDIAISGVVKMEDGSFRVTVHVIAHEEDEELTDEDEGEGEGRQNAHERQRSEEVSQKLKEEMDRQFYVHAHHMSMDEGLDEGEHAKEVIEDSRPDYEGETVEESSPDTLAYTQGRDSDSIFDIVGEVSEPSGPDAGGGSNYINVASHEVDEVIGLLSGGFYEPPRHEEQRAPEPERETPEPGRRAAPRRHPDEPVLEPS